MPILVDALGFVDNFGNQAIAISVITSIERSKNPYKVRILWFFAMSRVGIRVLRKEKVKDNLTTDHRYCCGYLHPECKNLDEGIIRGELFLRCL